MGLFSFNKVPRHRTFKFTPRYYDPEKEARDAIVRLAKMEAGLIPPDDMDPDIENAKHRITKAFHGRLISSNYKRVSNKQSNVRVVIIAIILTAIAYLILNFNFEELIQIFE